LGNSSIRPGYAGSLTILIEEVGNFREVAVPESANQTKLAQDRQQTLEDARAAKTAGGNAADSDRLVDDVFLVGIEEVLQQPGETVIVFRHNKHDIVGAGNGRGRR